MAKPERKNLLRTIEELRWDVWLAATAIGLTLFGVIMVYSASAGTKNPTAFLYGQIKLAALGLIVMLALRRVDYHRFAQPGFVYGFLGVCVILLLLVCLFVIGFFWGRHVGARPLLAGALISSIGVVLVLIAIPLGG